MALKTYGTMVGDWEQRIDLDRLRRERLARIKDGLAKSSMGALLCFDMNNVRPMLTITLSCDHRVVDGARGATFLNDIVAAISEPEKHLG